MTIGSYIFQGRILWLVNYISVKLLWNIKPGWFLFQVTQAVAKLGMSQIPQKDLLETVRLREQVTTKRSKQELPPPPPPKKRQIPVDLEAKKKWELFCTWYINILCSVLILYWSLIIYKFKHNYCNGNSTTEPLTTSVSSEYSTLYWLSI